MCSWQDEICACGKTLSSTPTHCPELIAGKKSFFEICKKGHAFWGRRIYLKACECPEKRENRYFFKRKPVHGVTLNHEAFIHALDCGHVIIDEVNPALVYASLAGCWYQSETICVRYGRTCGGPGKKCKVVQKGEQTETQVKARYGSDFNDGMNEERAREIQQPGPRLAKVRHTDARDNPAGDALMEAMRKLNLTGTLEDAFEGMHLTEMTLEDAFEGMDLD